MYRTVFITGAATNSEIPLAFSLPNASVVLLIIKLFNTSVTRVVPPNIAPSYKL